MDSSKDHFESQQPAAGAMQDYQSLRENTTASVGELREFLGRLKGRSPQEVMGIVAQSSLVRGISIATAGTLILLCAFTIGPWALADEQQAEQTAQNDQPTEENQNDQQPAVAADQSASDSDTNKPDVERAAAAMGIDKTETAPPDRNPLDNKLDNLLDGIE